MAILLVAIFALCSSLESSSTSFSSSILDDSDDVLEKDLWHNVDSIRTGPAVVVVAVTNPVRFKTIQWDIVAPAQVPTSKIFHTGANDIGDINNVMSFPIAADQKTVEIKCTMTDKKTNHVTTQVLRVNRPTQNKTLHRKNLLQLSNPERLAWQSALATLKLHGVYDHFSHLHVLANKPTKAGHNVVEEKSLFHSVATELAHANIQKVLSSEPMPSDGFNPLFLPWHRMFISVYESCLVSAGMTSGIPFFDWNDEKRWIDGQCIWTPKYIGNLANDVVVGPFAYWKCVHPNKRANTDLGTISKDKTNFGESSTPPPQLTGRIQRSVDYWRRLYGKFTPSCTYCKKPTDADDVLRAYPWRMVGASLPITSPMAYNLMKQKNPHWLHASMAIEAAHNSAHGLCGTTMNAFGPSPNDPAFWLVHGNTDRLYDLFLAPKKADDISWFIGKDHVKANIDAKTFKLFPWDLQLQQFLVPLGVYQDTCNSADCVACNGTPPTLNTVWAYIKKNFELKNSIAPPTYFGQNIAKTWIFGKKGTDQQPKQVIPSDVKGHHKGLLNPPKPPVQENSTRDLQKSTSKTPSVQEKTTRDLQSASTPEGAQTKKQGSGLQKQGSGLQKQGSGLQKQGSSSSSF